MSEHRPPSLAVRGRRRAAFTARIARLPGPRRTAAFLRQIRGPARASALRGVTDGLTVNWTLRRRGVRPLLATAGAAGTHDPERCRPVAAAVDAGLGMLPLAPTCLRRSMTLLRELHRMGLAATLHIGARTVDGVFEAHAWVQAGDQVLNDEPALVATYTELAAGDLERLVPLLR